VGFVRDTPEPGTKNFLPSGVAEKGYARRAGAPFRVPFDRSPIPGVSASLRLRLQPGSPGSLALFRCHRSLKCRNSRGGFPPDITIIANGSD
jgi:hypothetical protein